MPSDSFDEIKVVAYPVSNEQIEKDIEGIFEIISTKDTRYLKDTITKYGNVHATSSEDKRYDFSLSEIINYKAWQIILNGISIYEDGKAYRSHAHKYLVDGDFTIEFEDEDSYIDYTNRIIGLPTNDFNGKLTLILVFDKGYNIVKAFAVE